VPPNAPFPIPAKPLGVPVRLRIGASPTFRFTRTTAAFLVFQDCVGAIRWSEGIFEEDRETKIWKFGGNSGTLPELAIRSHHSIAGVKHASVV
jgi:hypothetical protein